MRTSSRGTCSRRGRRQRWYRQHDKSPSDVARMLILLTRLRDTARLDAFLSDIIARGLFDKGDNEAILGALGVLPPDRAAALLERIIAGTAATSLDACGNLLARARRRCAMAGELTSSAPPTALVEALPGNPARAAPRDPWQRDSARAARFRGRSFHCRRQHQLGSGGACRRAHPGLAKDLWPRHRTGPGGPRPDGSHPPSKARRRCSGCAWLASSICAPASLNTWRRRATGGARVRLGANALVVSELSIYLRDPERKIWTFKAAQADRSQAIFTGSVRIASVELCRTDQAIDRCSAFSAIIRAGK